MAGLKADQLAHVHVQFSLCVSAHKAVDELFQLRLQSIRSPRKASLLSLCLRMEASTPPSSRRAAPRCALLLIPSPGCEKAYRGSVENLVYILLYVVARAIGL